MSYGRIMQKYVIRPHYSASRYTGNNNKENHYPVSSPGVSLPIINVMPIMQINFRPANSLPIPKFCDFFVVIYMEKGRPEGEYDLVERAIRKTGCWKEHLASAECMSETRDWRECKDEKFRNCMQTYMKDKVQPSEKRSN
ncbi:unnamed protein product [Onchocerca ochengi]|uniref:NADH dehydrogenase [ubiquinone] 1 beta subcomplex subunit 7 n=1 Tax=Onchocerca ochengi TaxID=42157 RepID=A0A182E389_ONCOC|nr:unnamed protein product [Onchocerca ochengi]